VKIRSIILIISLLLIGLLGWVIYTYSGRIGKTKVSLAIVPGDANLTLDGEAISGSTLYLSPGSYTLKVDKAGFSSGKNTFSVPATKQIVMLLSPKSTEAKAWVAAHPQQAAQAEGIAAQNAANSGKAFADKNPILARVPYHSSIYNIDYGEDGDNLNLFISAPTALGRQVALAQIRSWGYDPTDYKITFTNFTNPFATTATGGKK
jgi:hypothetical protein